MYDKGECTFTSPAPTEGGQYTFTVDFYPSAGGHVVKTLRIPEPNGETCPLVVVAIVSVVVVVNELITDILHLSLSLSLSLSCSLSLSLNITVATADM